LGIDYGAATTAAVLAWPDGRWRPVLFDGQPGLPSAVLLTGGGEPLTGLDALRPGSDPGGLVAEPKRQLDDHHTGGDGVVDLIAATLRRVGQAATALAGEPVGDVRLVVPAGWGPRRRTVLRRAAHRAGLAVPSLVPAPVAVAQHLLTTGVQVPVGWWLVVCDGGAGFEAAVVARAAAGFEVVSTIATAEAGGRRVEQALGETLLAATVTATGRAAAVEGGDRVAVLAAARNAAQALARMPAVTVALPAGPPVVVTAAQLDAATGPVVEAAVEVTRQAVQAAELPVERCAGVFCVGGMPGLTALAQRVAAELQLPARVTAEPKLAAVLGTVHASAAVVDEVVAGPVEPPLRRAVGVLVPAVASLALVGQFYATARIESAFDRRYAYLLANWGELALAALAALLACLAAAPILALAVAGARAGRNDAPGPTDADQHPGQQVSTGLLAAVAGGLSIAGLYAMVGSVAFGLPGGAFLRWTLLACLPVALAAGGLALFALRGVDPGTAWHRFLAFPHASVACAAVGMLLLQHADTAPRYPATALLTAVSGRVGACLLGAAAAFAVDLPRRYQLILAAPLAIFAAAVGSGLTAGLLAVVYVVAVALWWGQRVWRLARRRAPHPAGGGG